MTPNMWFHPIINHTKPSFLGCVEYEPLLWSVEGFLHHMAFVGLQVVANDRCPDGTAAASIQRTFSAYSSSNGKPSQLSLVKAAGTGAFVCRMRDQQCADKWQPHPNSTHCTPCTIPLQVRHCDSCLFCSAVPLVSNATAGSSPTPMLISALDNKNSRWIQMDNKIVSIIQFSWLTKVSVDCIACYNQLPNGK